MEDDLQIDQKFVRTWHPRYDETESDEPEYQALITLTSTEIRQQKTISKPTFIRILNWKSQRLKGIVRRNEFDRYQEAIRVAYSAGADQKLEILVRLYGVAPPTASTLLHFIYPDSFPIIHVRTTETLYCAGLIRYRKTGSSHYPSFRSEMLKILSEVSPFTLREIDRALFAYHKNHLSPKLKVGVKTKEVRRRRGMTSIYDTYLRIFQNSTGEKFTSKEIKDLMSEAGINPKSVIPSDYCYNLVNRDPNSFKNPLFEFLPHKRYLWLGPDYPYSGVICWLGKPVGEWQQGKYQLQIDPRQ